MPKGIIFSVDAIQGLGAFTLDVEKCKVDFISCGTAKWLLGMQGLAFIYVSEKMQQMLKPKYVGWLSVEDAEIGIHPMLEGWEKENLSGIISFKPEKANYIHDELRKKEIYCSVREEMVRLSPHFYNTKEEIDKVVNEINYILSTAL